jgi:single-stranded-DNA-specific exonuclease
VAERFGKPTIILQEEGEFSKGSARSVGTFSIIDAIRQQEFLLERYGGHQAAAGITLRTDKIDEFRTALNNNLDADSLDKMQREIIADLWLESEFISQEGLDQLETLEPTGQSNPTPIFYLKTRLTQVKPVGQTGDHGQLFFDIEGQSQRAIAFQATNKWPFLKVGTETELLLAIRANE